MSNHSHTVDALRESIFDIHYNLSCYDLQTPFVECLDHLRRAVLLCSTPAEVDLYFDLLQETLKNNLSTPRC